MEAYKALVVHHTAMRGNPEDVLNVLNQRGLGVQYVMDRDGKLTQTLPDGSRAAHILKSEVAGLPLSNSNTKGVEVIAKDDSDVTPAQIEGMKRFYAEQKKLNPGLEIYGHGYLNPSHKQATEGKTIVDAIRKAEGKGPLNARDPLSVAREAAKDVPIAKRGFMGAYAGNDEKKALPLAGARAMGGPVGMGLSYLVGERGPEIFTPGATGQISTNGALGRLTDIGKRVIEGSGQEIAPQPERVAKARPDAEARSAVGASAGGGDRSFHAGNHTWNVTSGDPKGVRNEVERAMMAMIAQMESSQRGSLSD